jgi:beta-lactamase regulating signal transducer with metallopeptidase domain
MIPLLQYLLKVILVSGILTGYYWISLRNKRFHHYNRFYLVGAVLLSWGLPLLNLQWFYITPEPASPIHQVAEIIYSSPNAAPSAWALSWDRLLAVALLVVAIVLLLVFLVGILQLFLIKSKGRVTPMERFDFIETTLEDAPFSFFRNLFWKKDCAVNDENGQRILRHEITHIEQHHSIDKVLASLSTCLGWMNLFFWLIRKELEVVHEFIADEAAISNNDASQLAEMLLTAQYSSSLFSNGQSFFYSSIKRRIIMLSSSKNTSYSYARRLLVLPISLCALALLSFTIRNNGGEPKQSFNDSGTNTTILIDTIPAQFRDPASGKLKGNYQLDIQEDTAVFRDSKSKKILFKSPLNQLGEMASNKNANKFSKSHQDKNMTFFYDDSLTFTKGVFIKNTNSPRIILNGILYSPNDINSIRPISVKTIRINGGDTVPTITIDTDPTVMIDTTLNRGKNTDDKISYSQRKIIQRDGKESADTMYITDISLKKVAGINIEPSIKPEAEDLTIIKKDADGNVVYTFTQKRTAKAELLKDILYVIDGQESDAATLKNLDPNSIKSVNVLKGKSANNKYGDKGNNGVIEIITKK